LFAIVTIEGRARLHTVVSSDYLAHFVFYRIV
jgi:hypothetical protein